MDRLAKLVALCLVLCAHPVFAGYAQLQPPPGWSAGAGGGATFRAGAAAANEAQWVANTVRTSAALNVGGSAVEVPVAMRFAANAPRLAARAMFGSPVLLVGAAAIIAAPYAYQWAKDQGFFVKDGQWVKDELQCENGSCFMFKGYNDQLFFSANGACSSYKAQYKNTSTGGSSDTFTFAMNGSQCEIRETYRVKYGDNWVTQVDNQVIGRLDISKVPQPPTTAPRPVLQPEFEETLAPLPMPAPVPKEIPFDVPVEAPVINPSPTPANDPNATPTPSPLNIPQGLPQPVPNTDPQQYRVPYIVVTPAPTPANPWQVDVKPGEVVSTNPSPDPAADPAQDPASKPKPSTTSENSDLCLLHPDILACAKPVFDTPQSSDLPTKDAVATVTPDSGWGADNAQCPAPRYIYPQGRQVAIPFDLFCTYMAGLRPIIIAMAWLGAAFILVGAKGD